MASQKSIEITNTMKADVLNMVEIIRQEMLDNIKWAMKHVIPQYPRGMDIETILTAEAILRLHGTTTVQTPKLD